MRIVSAADLDRCLDYATLMDRIRDWFVAECEVPVRHHHHIHLDDEPDATLLLMPAWRHDAFIGVKVVTIFPGNAARGVASVMGNYLVIDGRTGEQLALLEGKTLTVRRTAAASALAARYLAHSDASTLLVIGTGSLAPHMARAHALARPIRDLLVWGRTPDKARALADRLAAEGLPARPAADLEAAVGQADVISCATLSPEPLVRGAWLRPGQHVDLVGAYTPRTRESDDEAVRRASVFVDTRQGALKEAGDLVIPIGNGTITADHVRGDLFDLCRGTHPGRTRADEITLFKSVGTAVEDLAAAALALERI